MPKSASSRTSTGGTTGSKPCAISTSMPQRSERELEQHHVALEVGEARARHPRRGLHVDQPAGELEVVARLVRPPRLADLAHRGVLVGRARVGRVRDQREHALQLLLDRRQLLRQRLHAPRDLLHLGDRVGRVAALLLRARDRLRGLVLARPQPLDLGQQLAPPRVERQRLVQAARPTRPSAAPARRARRPGPAGSPSGRASLRPRRRSRAPSPSTSRRTPRPPRRPRRPRCSAASGRRSSRRCGSRRGRSPSSSLRWSKFGPSLYSRLLALTAEPCVPAALSVWQPEQRSTEQLRAPRSPDRSWRARAPPIRRPRRTAARAGSASSRRGRRIRRWSIRNNRPLPPMTRPLLLIACLLARRAAAPTSPRPSAPRTTRIAITVKDFRYTPQTIRGPAGPPAGRAHQPRPARPHVPGRAQGRHRRQDLEPAARRPRQHDVQGPQGRVPLLLRALQPRGARHVRHADRQVRAVEPDRFRTVMGHFATGVAVVTVDTPTGPAGHDRQRGRVA